jgi:hypothetical protein
MSTTPEAAAARVRRFLDLYGTPTAPIATARQRDEDGRPLINHPANLLASDLRALLEERVIGSMFTSLLSDDKVEEQ